MAARGIDPCGNSSSSEDEQLRRCQEAVWVSPEGTKQDPSSSKMPSKRLVVADHDHDANELQVTQGFQIHVAKKLGAILDSFISEKPSSAQIGVKTDISDSREDDDDEGFRLFSTSIPGQKPEEPPPKRRPLPSSSDSDSEMEMRLKEAAISIQDLLPSSVLATNLTTPETPLETKEKIKPKKKKKKKQLNAEEDGQQDSYYVSDIVSENGAQNERAQINVKRKKKKKKASSGNTIAEVLCLK